MSLVYNNCSYNGVSHIAETNENGVPVAVMSMNASLDNGYLQIHKNISNIDLYKANKETADADYAEFEAKVYKAFGITAE